MSRIAIVTDTVASIPEALLAELNITTVAYYIHRGKEVFRDLLTMKRNEFFAWMEQTETLPKTACPGPGDYASAFEKLWAKGFKEIISIHMTSKRSGAYQAARSALPELKERFPALHIEVIDTLNVSMCQGWIAIEAARQAVAGKTLDQILKSIDRLIPKTKMIQTADTLKYLYMGGRIGKAQHLMGSILNIKPLISMKNGEIIALGQSRSRKRAYEKIAKLVEDMAKNRPINIAYVHAAALEEVEKIKIEVEKRVKVAESIFAELSPALGVHTGPGTAGVCFYPTG